jgi:hypothetical protein
MADGMAFTGADAITFTCFRDYAASEKWEVSETWEELAHRIRFETKPRKDSLPWLKLACFGSQKTDKGSLRHDANVLAITGIEGDYDGEQHEPAYAVEKLHEAGVRAMVYTSPSHTEDTPRWRVLCPTSTPLSPEQRERLMGRLNGVLGGILSGESFTLSQAYFYGSVKMNPSHVVELVEGRPIDLCGDLDAGWMGKSATGESTLGADGKPRAGRVNQAQLVKDIVSGEAFHASTLRLAGAWAFAGVSLVDAREQILHLFDTVPEDQRGDRWNARRGDVERCLLDVYAREGAKKDKTPQGGAVAGEGGRVNRALPSSSANVHKANGKTFAGNLRIMSVSEVLALPPREYLIPGLMAPGEMSVCWGAPKCGKTFVMMRLVFGAALGLGLWGKVPARPLRVLYAAAEGEGGIGTRLTALHEELGDPGDNFAVIAQRMEIGPPSQHLADLIAASRHHRAEIVVVDTLARTFGEGDEDRAQDMGTFIAALDRIREEGRADDGPMPHVVVIHHGSKDPAAKTPRGSGSLMGAADLVLRIKKGEDGAPSMAIIDCAKDDEDGTELPFRLKAVTIEREGRPDRRTCIAEESDPPPNGKRADRLTDNQRGWLRDLNDLFADPNAAEERNPVQGMAPVKTLTREQVRDGLRRKGRLPNAEPNAPLVGAARSQLHNMLNTLKDKGKLGLTDHFVWLL